MVGAGHGGSAMAAHLALLGFPVRLSHRARLGSGRSWRSAGSASSRATSRMHYVLAELEVVTEHG